jgi:N-acetylglucosaminyldiphosphoundecaprenol N-acetyl-beta-D-mannosaminyltransferase
MTDEVKTVSQNPSVPQGTTTMKNMQRIISVLGLPFANVTMRDTIDKIEAWIAEGGFHQVATANVDFLSRALADVHLQQILCNCDMVLPDGMPIVWASKMVGAPLRERVTGVDLVQRLAEGSARSGYRIFLLGAREEVARKAISWMEAQYPGVCIAGQYSPELAPLEDMDHADILRRIKAAKADVLLVAFGNPKQERWIAMHRDRLPVSVAIGIGGSLDIIAGQVDRAPTWMQNTGLEWFFRMAQEPARLAPRYLRNLKTLAQYLPALLANQRRPSRLYRNSYYLHVEDAKPGTIITLRGSLSETGADSVLDEVMRAAKAPMILMNLSHTTHVGADGLGVLLEARRIAMGRGQQFSLYGVSRRLRRVFQHAQVEQILSATPNMQEVFVSAPKRKTSTRATSAGQMPVPVQQTI